MRKRIFITFRLYGSEFLCKQYTTLANYKKGRLFDDHIKIIKVSPRQYTSRLNENITQLIIDIQNFTSEPQFFHYRWFAEETNILLCLLIPLNGAIINEMNRVRICLRFPEKNRKHTKIVQIAKMKKKKIDVKRGARFLTKKYRFCALKYVARCQMLLE